MQKIAVLGLGRFGQSVARALSDTNAEVVAADRNGRLVDDVRDHVSVAVQLDTTDEDAMRAQNIGEMDVCVVAIGEGFEAALLTTLIAKKLGVRRVIARAQTPVQADILSRVGADEISCPEIEAGERLANRLAHPHLENLMELDEVHDLVQVRAPEAFRGKSLGELKLRQKLDINIIAIKRPLSGTSNDGPTGPGADQQWNVIVPKAEDKISDGDVLLLVGHRSALARLPRH